MPVSPPAALLRCSQAPSSPMGKYTQDDVSDFVLDLSEADADCREKLDALRHSPIGRKPYSDDLLSRPKAESNIVVATLKGMIF